MTNKEKYKQAFSVLHASDDIFLEVEKMRQISRKQKIQTVAAAAAACAILIGGSASAYAADVGGIQTKLSMWIHGSQSEVDVKDNGDGGYTFTYEEDGEMKKMGGGGVSIDEEGNETQISAEEMLNNMNESADVETDENGRVWLYYYEQKVDITDLFDEEGICRVVLSHDGKKVYVEVAANPDGSYPLTQENKVSGRKRDLYTEMK